MNKTIAQIESDVFAEAKRLATQKESKAEGLARMISLALEGATPGICLWAKQFLEAEFNLKIGVSHAVESATGGVSRQSH